MTTDPTRPNEQAGIDQAKADQIRAERLSAIRRGRLTAGVLALAVLSFAAGGFLFAPNTMAKVQTAFQPPSAATQVAANAAPFDVAANDADQGKTPRLLEQGQPFSFANLVEHVSPAVVTILVDKERKVADTQVPDNIPPPFRQFFRNFGNRGDGDQNDQGPQTLRSRALGSGFIIDPNGYVVTNNHVIANETKIQIKLPDKRQFEAHVVGTDPDTDVALLKINGVHNLPTVQFGNDRNLRVGDWVIAVGNPFGLGGTVTAGIVSSIGRDIGSGPYTDYIQIDAPINEGNSGGPTFDMSGHVVGMNSAIYTPSGGSVGIGFAIPSSTVQAIVAQLKAHGHVTRGWLGVSIQNLTPDMASSLGVPNAKGAIVANVFDNSPAQRAGFQQGDVVLAVNGKDVNDERDLTRRVGNLQAGEHATFAILRDGKKETLTATIAKRNPKQVAALAQNPGASAAPNGPSISSLGLTLVPLNPALRQQYNLDDDINGVLITAVDPDSEAAEKGVSAGMVIESVSNKAVQLPSDVTHAIAEAKDAGRDSVLFLVADHTGHHYIALKLDSNDSNKG